jgi:hypothetical protein
MKQYSIILAIGIAGIVVMGIIFGMDILKLSISRIQYFCRSYFR